MLEEGQIIKLPSSGLAEVLSVNDSRAHIKFLSKTEKTFHTKFSDEEIHFSSSGGTLDISPNSEVEIINKTINKQRRSHGTNSTIW